MANQIRGSLARAPILLGAFAVACGNGPSRDGASEGGLDDRGTLVPDMEGGGGVEAGPSSAVQSDAGSTDGPAESDAGSPSGPGTSSVGDGSLPTDAAIIGDGGGARYYLVSNQCAQTVWAAARPTSTFPGGIVEMAPGYSFEVHVSDGWSGRIWGKTQCNTANGTLLCASDPFPSSLAELTLTKTPATGLDFYDVSLVDGFNLPIEVVAIGHTPNSAHPYDCGNPACVQDLIATCPQPLIDRANGAPIACANDECRVLGGSDAASPDCKYPNQYTEFFKTACPTAYSYPYDDPTSTFTCKGENSYAIVFCP
jgi:hypothetical protein